jgi:hypothetical protein
MTENMEALSNVLYTKGNSGTVVPLKEKIHGEITVQHVHIKLVLPCNKCNAHKEMNSHMLHCCV